MNFANVTIRGEQLSIEQRELLWFALNELCITVIDESQAETGEELADSAELIVEIRYLMHKLTEKE